MDVFEFLTKYDISNEEDFLKDFYKVSDFTKKIDKKWEDKIKSTIVTWEAFLTLSKKFRPDDHDKAEAVIETLKELIKK